MRLLFGRGQTTQPGSFAGLNRAHPSFPGLKLACIPAHGYQESQNLVTGVPLQMAFVGTGTSGGARPIQTKEGGAKGGVYVVGANSRIVVAPDVFYSGGEFSVLCIRTGAQQDYEISCGDGTASNGWALKFSGNANTPAIVNNGSTVSHSNWYATTARRLGAVLHIFRSASLDSYSQTVPGLTSTAHSITPASSAYAMTMAGYTTSLGVVSSGSLTGALVLYWDRALSAAEAVNIVNNPWQIFATPQARIWVPAAAASGTAAITQADGASTTSTLAGSSSAATTPTAAAGTSTTSSITGGATAAADITGAASASTSGALAGVAVFAGAITQADGVSTAATLTGTGLTAGSSSITAAAGSSTASVLAGSSVAESAIAQASGTSTAGTLTGTDGIAAASLVPASGGTTAAAFAASATAAAVAIAAAGASAAATLASNGAVAIAGALAGNRPLVTGVRPTRLQTTARPTR